MTDSTPNSPNEFIRRLPADKRLIAKLEQKMQLIKLMQEHYSNYKDDEIIEINASELKSILKNSYMTCEALEFCFEQFQAFTK